MMKFLVFFFPIFFFAQQKITPQYIDAEYNRAEALDIEGKSDESIKKNMFLLERSKQINYSKGIALGYLNLSCHYSYLKNYKKGLEYLKLAQKEEYVKKNLDFQINLKRQLGFNYYNMGLYHQAITEYKEIAVLSDKISVDTLRAFTKFSAYCDIGVAYKGRNQPDSCKWYLKKGIAVLRNEKKLTRTSKAGLLFYSLGLSEIYITEKKIDSAEITLKLIETDSKKVLGNNNYLLYKVKGLIDENKKKYDSAISNYQKAIPLAKNIKNVTQLQWLYNEVSKIYQQTGEKDSATKYFQKYTSIKDSLEKARQPAIENTVQELVAQKENKIKAKNEFLLYGIWIGAFGVLIFILLAISRIHKKNKILHVKEKETKLLNQKLNLAFDEVVQLAKNNDPEFLTRFQEVYPEFFPKLLKIEPQLLNTELKFCALLFLNFSTKDIASYTFVQPQSVQTRKNRLRKRLNISSDEDIYLWMKNVNSTI